MENINGVLTPKNSLTGEISGGSNIGGDITIPKNVGTQDYEKLQNLPSLESVELRGNKTFADLGLEECSNQDIINLFK